MAKLNLLIATLLVTLAVGCQPQGPRVATANPANTELTKTALDFEIKTGLHSDGEDYDRLFKMMTESNAKIRLDVHSGIFWNESHKIEDIGELIPLLKSNDKKSVVFVSTGKAVWDKEDEYVEKIVAFGKEFGYKITVVIDDHSSGIFVRKTIQH